MMENFKKVILQNVHITDVLFGALWLYGWFHNAEQLTKYDLDKLINFYAVIRGYIFADRVNDSVNNSAKGELPK